MGSFTIGSLTTGTRNTASGYEALRNTNASENVAVGYRTLLANTIGNSNVGVGDSALSSVTIGNYNTAIGANAGTTIAWGSNNIAIGWNAQVPFAVADNQIRMGNTAISQADIQVAWNITSDRRYKKNIQQIPTSLALINSLRPVSYQRINDADATRWEAGFIAQEVEEAMVKLGLPNRGIIAIDERGNYGVRYNDFIPILVRGMQEQQLMIEDLKKPGATSKGRIARPTRKATGHHRSATEKA